MFRTLHDIEHVVTIHIDGVPVTAESGETLASVLLRQADAWTRTTPISGVRRAPYCMMGVCFECLMEIDGESSVQACLTAVRDGMIVRRQVGRRSIAR